MVELRTDTKYTLVDPVYQVGAGIQGGSDTMIAHSIVSLTQSSPAQFEWPVQLSVV